MKKNVYALLNAYFATVFPDGKYVDLGLSEVTGVRKYANFTTRRALEIYQAGKTFSITIGEVNTEPLFDLEIYERSYGELPCRLWMTHDHVKTFPLAKIIAGNMPMNCFARWRGTGETPWVDRKGGLPAYVEGLADGTVEKRYYSEGHCYKMEKLDEDGSITHTYDYPLRKYTEEGLKETQ